MIDLKWNEITEIKNLGFNFFKLENLVELNIDVTNN